MYYHSTSNDIKSSAGYVYVQIWDKIYLPNLISTPWKHYNRYCVKIVCSSLNISLLFKSYLYRVTGGIMHYSQIFRQKFSLEIQENLYFVRKSRAKERKKGNRLRSIQPQKRYDRTFLKAFMLLLRSYNDKEAKRDMTEHSSRHLCS